MYQMDEPCGSGFCGRRRIVGLRIRRGQGGIGNHGCTATPCRQHLCRQGAETMAAMEAAVPGPVMDDGSMPEDGEGSPMVAHNTEEYRYNPENPFMAVSGAPLSTFGADVDTASYANIRRMLLGGSPVPEDAVRIEEMLNYFYYDYPEPKEQEPFSVTTRLAECPWNQPHSLLQIGLQAKKLDEDALPASNLVFLLDVSGSMDAPDKLDLVKRAFLTMTENLKDGDSVSIVTYASSDKVVLDGASGSDRTRIMTAIETLRQEEARRVPRVLRPHMNWRRSIS